MKDEKSIRFQILKDLGLDKSLNTSSISSDETEDQESEAFLDRMSDIGVPVEPRPIKKDRVRPNRLKRKR